VAEVLTGMGFGVFRPEPGVGKAKLFHFHSTTGPGAGGAKLGQTPNTNDAAALHFPVEPVPGSLTMARLQEATVEADATDLPLPNPPPPVWGMGTVDSVGISMT
jgi:hypothetical protein